MADSSLRSLPVSDQMAVRELAREIMAQADGLLTMLECVRRARAELGV